MLSLFYIRWLIKTITVINEDVKNVADLVREFATHTKQVYELEMFYGDDTLKKLMDHASQVSEKLSDLDLVLNEEEETDAEEDASSTTQI
jgi:hypothetical protein